MIVLFSQSDREETLIHLLETEPLFVALQDCMDQYDKLMMKHTTKVENWVDAKEFMANLFKSPVPTAMVNIEYQKLCNKSTAIDSNRRGKGGYSGIMTGLPKILQEREIEIVLSYSLIIAYYLICTREEQKFKDVFKKLKSLCSEHGLSRREILAEMELSITTGFENGSITDIYDYTKPDGGIENTAEQPEEIAPAVDEQDISTPENNMELRTELTAAAVVLAVEEYKTASTERKKLLLSAISGLNPTTFNNVVSSLSDGQKKLAEKRLKEIIEEKK